MPSPIGDTRVFGFLIHDLISVYIQAKTTSHCSLNLVLYQVYIQARATSHCSLNLVLYQVYIQARTTDWRHSERHYKMVSRFRGGHFAGLMAPQHPLPP